MKRFLQLSMMLSFQILVGGCAVYPAAYDDGYYSSYSSYNYGYWPGSSYSYRGGQRRYSRDYDYHRHDSNRGNRHWGQDRGRRDWQADDDRRQWRGNDDRRQWRGNDDRRQWRGNDDRRRGRSDDNGRQGMGYDDRRGSRGNDDRRGSRGGDDHSVVAVDRDRPRGDRPRGDQPRRGMGDGRPQWDAIGRELRAGRQPDWSRLGVGGR